MSKPRTSVPIAAQIDVLTELPSPGGVRVRVRAKAAKGHETDARPVGGFFVVRRYEGDEFYLTDWRQFSRNWMEFVEPPPKEWIDAMKLAEDQKAELMAKKEIEQKRSPEELLVFALSQAMRQQGRAPADFDYSSGQFKTGQQEPTKDATI